MCFSGLLRFCGCKIVMKKPKKKKQPNWNFDNDPSYQELVANIKKEIDDARTQGTIAEKGLSKAACRQKGYSSTAA